MEHETSTVKKSKHCFILLTVEKVRWKGRSSPEPTEFFYQTRLQQVINKRSFPSTLIFMTLLTTSYIIRTFLFQADAG